MSVSCVIPVYNGEAYIGQAIESVLAQTSAVEEIIVVDDGSTDDTARVVSSSSDSIRYIRTQHAGVSAARNEGMRLARGEFIAFLDADDLWLPGKVEKQLEVFARFPNTQICQCLYRNFWSPELTSAVRLADPRSRSAKWAEIRPGQISSWVVRRSLPEAIGGFDPDLTLGEDTDWSLRAREAGMERQTLFEVLVLRRLHSTNVTADMHAGRVDDLLRVVKRKIDRGRDFGTRPARGHPASGVSRCNGHAPAMAGMGLVPSAHDTDWLRACVGSGASARKSWERWLRGVEDPKRFLAEDRRDLSRGLAFLHQRLVENDAGIPKALGPYLRAARFTEELRAQLMAICARDALTALAEAGVDATPLRGCILAETVYPKAALRHCHEVNVWVAGPHRERAAHALSCAGFVSAAGSRNAVLRFAQPSGASVAIHTELVPADPGWPAGEMRRRRLEATIHGVFARILAPPDLLAHGLAHAAGSPERSSLVWAVDSCLLLERYRDLDWSVFVEVVRGGPLREPIRVLVDYLRRSLDAPIPPEVDTELRDGVFGRAGSAG